VLSDEFAFAEIKVKSENLGETITFIEDIWHQYAPETPFDYSFLDEDFDALFRSEQRLGQIFGIFTGLAIFVACLGLLALAAFMAEQRTKEIGIRKVLGASVSHIVILLSKDFTRLILIAFLIAMPIGYFAMNYWLENFAYRIEIGVGVFAVAGVIALAIAWLTVSWQSVKAALMNPVESLRNE
jgi:putative ABC transport system permease protein